jgi:uncharacterized membrane protein YraQ (UPF0718 family)
VNQPYNHAHDHAQRLARRHERDLLWAKERRRQREREIATARRLLAMRRTTLARTTVQVTSILLLVIVAGFWCLSSIGLPDVWMMRILWLAAALVVTVLIGALMSLSKLKARRAAARSVLRSHEARLSHTQYHIDESVHSFVDSRVDVWNTRVTHLV